MELRMQKNNSIKKILIFKFVFYFLSCTEINYTTFIFLLSIFMIDGDINRIMREARIYAVDIRKPE